MVKYTGFLLLTIFCLGKGIISSNIDDDYLKVHEVCHQFCQEKHRHCKDPPFTCGHCLSSFEESSGDSCQKTDALTEEDSIDGIAIKAHKNRNQASHKNKEVANADLDFGLAPQEDDGLKYDFLLGNHGIEGQGQRHKTQVHKVHHHPGHSQQQKVEAVQEAADIVPPKEVHDLPTAAPMKQNPAKNVHNFENTASMADVYFLAVVAGCSVAGLVGLVVAGVCWYRLQKNVKAASEAEYPAYGVTGPTKERLGSPGDRKLAQSAQMYHYQHQKQQMIALEKANGEMKHDGSDEDSEEENEEGDYTVYECPGLAPTGEMEVKNPLFSEETPVTPTPNGADPSDHGHK